MSDERPQSRSSDAERASEVSNISLTDNGGTQPWDELLAKYVRVWIWSLLFGATSGLSYVYVGFRLDRPWGPLAAFPLALFVLGVLAALGAWWSLLIYLRYTILPTFFDSKRAMNHDEQEWARKRSAASITKAYKYILLAGIVRLLLAMSDLVFEMLRSMPFIP